MQVDPDNVHAAMHKPFLSGIMEVLLVFTTATAIAAAIWGKRIWKAVGICYRWVVDLLTNNDKLRSRMTTSEVTQARIEQDLAVIQKQVATILETLSPPGRRSNREILEQLETRSTIAAARWKAMIDHDTTPKFECDSSGACTYANASLCHLLGLSLDQMLGNGWTESIPGAERAKVFAAWEHAVRTNLPYDYEYNISVPGGTRRVRARAIAVTQDGRTILYMGTVTPLT